MEIPKFKYKMDHKITNFHSAGEQCSVCKLIFVANLMANFKLLMQNSFQNNRFPNNGKQNNALYFETVFVTS